MLFFINSALEKEGKKINVTGGWGNSFKVLYFLKCS